MAVAVIPSVADYNCLFITSKLHPAMGCGLVVFLEPARTSRAEMANCRFC